MKAPKSLLILLIPLLCVPAAASAQIIIDRYNSGSDPTQPVVKKDDEDKKDDKEAEGEEADEKSTELTADELRAIRDELLKELQKTHAQCMKIDDIIRPDKAKITGTATWEVDEKGNAKFKESTSEVAMEMFFTSDAEVAKLKTSDKDAARQRSNQLYNDCAKNGSDVKVDVEGKKGEVSVGFSVSHQNDRTTVQLSDGGDEGGSVAIDL